MRWFKSTFSKIETVLAMREFAQPNKQRTGLCPKIIGALCKYWPRLAKVLGKSRHVADVTVKCLDPIRMDVSK